jgi:hypothetical protein
MLATRRRGEMQWTRIPPFITEKTIFTYLKASDPQFHGCLTDFQLSPAEWSNLLTSDDGPVGRFSDGATVMVGDDELLNAFDNLQLSSHYLIRGLTYFPRDATTAASQISSGLTLLLDALAKVHLFLIRDAGDASEEQKQRAAVRNHVPREAKAFLDDPSFFPSGAGGGTLSGTRSSAHGTSRAPPSSAPSAAAPHPTPPSVLVYPITVAAPPMGETRLAISSDGPAAARANTTPQTQAEPEQQQQHQQPQPLTAPSQGAQPSSPATPRPFPLAPPSPRVAQPRQGFAPGPRSPLPRVQMGPRPPPWGAGERRPPARVPASSSHYRGGEEGRYQQTQTRYRGGPRSNSAGRRSSHY